MDTAFGDYLIGIGQGGVYQGPMGQFTTWYFDNPGMADDGTYPTYVSGRQAFPDQGWYYDPMNLGDLFNETAGGATFYQPMDGGPAVIPDASDPSINTKPPYDGAVGPTNQPAPVPTSGINAAPVPTSGIYAAPVPTLPDAPPLNLPDVGPIAYEPPPTQVTPDTPYLPPVGIDGDQIIPFDGETPGLQPIPQASITPFPIPNRNNTGGSLGIQPHKTTRTWASNSGTNLRGGIPDNRVKSVKNLNRTDSRFIRTLST